MIINTEHSENVKHAHEPYTRITETVPNAPGKRSTVL
jgi:hypothetical protein